MRELPSFRLPREARLVRFPAADGTELEGRWTPGRGERGVVLCHPHPLYGGSMLSPVVMAAEEAFRTAAYATLAFNFRGVGGSRGVHGGGQDEEADVEGALAWVERQLASPPRLAVAGYSFGSLVGGRVAARRDGVAWYLGIAPPLTRDRFRFLEGAGVLVAFVAGRRDELGDPDALKALCRSLRTPCRVWWLDTDHFFEGAFRALGEACRAAIAWADGEATAGPGSTGRGSARSG